MPTRRTFLATVGVAALGLAGVDAKACGSTTSGRKLKRIGLQLYTVRDLMKADLPGTLAQVAAIGYNEVEFAGYFDRTPTEIRDLLAKNNLTSPSTHLPIELLEKNLPKTFADAKTIGHQWVTLPWLSEERRKTADDWKRMASLLNKFGSQARSAGLRFAYHNHDFEIRPVGGVRPLDTLLTETDPSLVDFEMDLYWVIFGGGDPLYFFKRYPNRFPLVHVKDSAGPPDNRMVDVGAGKIDFRSIFAANDRIQHYFVEHDQPADPIATIRNSYNYLHALSY
ncbi:MAG: sugar phosphate isomerase/epimerase family protein [Gemmatimonadaceae bacterium]